MSMKRTLYIFGVFLLAGCCAALASTNDITALLQKGLFEEEANRNYDLAIQAYQSAIDGFDHDRSLAATAIFRLGECYRKLGRTNDANAQYQRILREFPEQLKLVESSREYISQLPTAAAAPGDDEMTSDERNEVARLREMVRTSPDLVNAGHGDPQTPLGREASAGWAAAMKILLDNGADPNALSSQGYLPICNAAEAGHNEAVKLLLERGANVNGRGAGRFSGATALHEAAGQGYLTVMRTLLAHGADVNATNSEGETPLHLVADASNTNIADFLLKNGARIDAETKSGQTALGSAAERGRTTMVDFLLSRGADINARGPDGSTQLALMIRPDVSSDAVKLLLDKGADPNLATKAGRAPLHLAASKNYGGEVQLLLDHHARVDAVDNEGQTPLSLLSKYQGQQVGQGRFLRMPPRLGQPASSSPDTRELLLKAGASEDPQRLDGIFVTEKGSGSIGEKVFSKANDSGEPHSLMELIARMYGPLWNGVSPTRDVIPFPDLQRLVIHHYSGGASNLAVVDFDLILKSGDCSKDTPLQWGDVVEIAEADHSLGLQWSGLSDASILAMEKCFRRDAAIVVKGQTNHVTLTPLPSKRNIGYTTTVRWGNKSDINSCDLNAVIHDSNLLLLSSDLSRVAVLRSGKPALAFNLETAAPQPFVLHDGDVVVIPEKPGS